MKTKRNLINLLGFSSIVITTYFGTATLDQQNLVLAKADKLIALETKEAKLGYMFAVQIASGIVQDGVAAEMDKEAFYAGFDEIFSGSEARMTEEEMSEIYNTFRLKKQAEAAAAALVVKEKGKAYLEQNKDKDGVIVTESGLQYEVLRPGKGTQASKDQTVVLHYEGRLIDGTVFDSSQTLGKPAEFSLESVIPGFAEGIALMKEGAKHRLTIPSELAYGEQGGPGGPHQVLIFEIELIEVK